MRGRGGSYVKWGLDVQEDALKRGERPAGDTWGAEAPEAWGIVHDGTSGVPLETGRGDYPEFYRQVERAVRGEGPVPVDARDAVRSLEIIEAARRSSLERQTVAIEV